MNLSSISKKRPIDGHTVSPVSVPVDSVTLQGEMFIPANAKGLVIFAHGSGSSRFSPRNRYVANVLHEHKVGTLLIDLLTADEEKTDSRTHKIRFDIPLLAKRLVDIGEWVMRTVKDIKIGYFGASTGGAAVLIAASHQPDKVASVVSRGGRPDLAMDFLAKVKAPTLLIVGEHDPMVFAWNKQALEKLNKNSRLDIIPRATHLGVFMLMAKQK